MFCRSPAASLGPSCHHDDCQSPLRSLQVAAAPPLSPKGPESLRGPLKYPTIRIVRLNLVKMSLLHSSGEASLADPPRLREFRIMWPGQLAAGLGVREQTQSEFRVQWRGQKRLPVLSPPGPAARMHLPLEVVESRRRKRSTVAVPVAAVARLLGLKITVRRVRVGRALAGTTGKAEPTAGPGPDTQAGRSVPQCPGQFPVPEVC